ncbi:unnamed protein product [Tilletia controversa]|nr:unnamed protein product [Tilletia controversa]
MELATDKNQKLCFCNKCGPEGRSVNRITYQNHLFAFDEGYSSGPDAGFGEQGHDEAPDGMEGAYQGYIDSGAGFDGGEFDGGQLARATADLIPTEEDLLTGAFELEIDSDDSDSDPQSASIHDSSSQPEWLHLSELLLAWLNVDHSVPDRTCELLLVFMQAVAYTISAGTLGSGKRKGLSARMARVRKTLGLNGLGVTYALCPDRSCWTPHLLKVAIEQRVLTCRNCGKDLFQIPQHSVQSLRRVLNPSCCGKSRSGFDMSR